MDKTAPTLISPIPSVVNTHCLFKRCIFYWGFDYLFPNVLLTYNEKRDKEKKYEKQLKSN